MLMIPLFQRHFHAHTVMAFVMCLISALITLILTLNYTAALIVGFFGCVSVLFLHSYSKAWLTLLLIILLFPAIRVSGDTILLLDIMLVSLSVVGLVNLVINRMYLPTTSISYYLFLLVLLGSTFIGFGYVFGQQINKHIWYFTFTILLTWLALSSFQFFFQTRKRLHRFFFLIMCAGVIHSVFGLIMFWGGWQTASGLGIISDKVQHVIFASRNYQINGFLGIGLLGRLHTNPLVPLLMISIPVTIGFILQEHRSSFQIASSHKGSIRWEWGSMFRTLRILVGAHTNESLRFAMHVRFSRWIRCRECWFWIALLLQATTFILTFTYTGLLFLLIGILTFAILDRKRRFVIATSSLIVLLTIIFPSFGSSVTIRSEENIARWFDGFHLIARDWIWGSGWNTMPISISNMNSQIHNSYLYIWNNFGIIGLVVFLVILGEYFRHLLKAYKQSDGENRIWLMVICAVYVGLVLEGLTSNTLFYGPAALLFWLLFGATLNLKHRRVVFGLTETKLLP